MAFKYKFEMYKSLQANIPNIYAEAKKAADEIGVPADVRGKFGLTGAISGCPGPLRQDIMDAIVDANSKVIPLAVMVDELRTIVRDIYGDGFDACPVSTCEAGLWLSFDTLFTPPALGRGDNYRARYIAPYEKHLHHQGGYGRPFPPRYKDIIADRGSTAGELGFYGKRQNNLDTIITPLAGADYSVHGIKYHPVPLLTKVDPKASFESIMETAERNADLLTGITSLGYETPGYGYSDQDADGCPKLNKYYTQIAKAFNIPYVIDNAWGCPAIGHDIRKSGADAIVYSMDKATGAATSGLVIGTEEIMVPIRRAMGMHGDRWGTGSTYGKAAYVTFDPGKDAIASQIQALKVLRDTPEVLTKPVDDLYDIIVAEYENLNPKLRKGFVITKSYNSRAVEINYEGTWANYNGGKGEMGVPIFSIEDMYSGTNLLQTGMAQMGIIPTVAYDGNIYVSPDLGTTDSKGNLDKDLVRIAIKAQIQLIEIISKYAGIL